MEVISTYFKEEGGFKARAEVVKANNEYKLVVYDQNGEFVAETAFPGKSLYYVESAGENWALGFQVLNG